MRILDNSGREVFPSLLTPEEVKVMINNREKIYKCSSQPGYENGVCQKAASNESECAIGCRNNDRGVAGSMYHPCRLRIKEIIGDEPTGHGVEEPKEMIFWRVGKEAEKVV